METNSNIATQETAKKTRKIDYDRTDKSPHSFRYKRGHAFAVRTGSEISLSKDPDGALVVGPAPVGSTPAVANLVEGEITLVSVKKRPNGKTGITFTHSSLGEIVAYDARAARSALRSVPAAKKSNG